MAVVEGKLERGLLIKLLKNNLSWSESILNSFTYEELSRVYHDLILNGTKVYKAKVSLNGFYGIQICVPKELRITNGLTYGDRFNIKVNLVKKEVYFDFSATTKGKYKLSNNGIIYLPMTLVEKNVLKQADDAMLYYEDGRITVKSFTFMQ